MNKASYLLLFLAAAAGFFGGQYYEKDNSERMLSNLFMGLSPECRIYLGEKLDVMEKIINKRRKKAGMGTVQELEGR